MKSKPSNSALVDRDGLSQPAAYRLPPATGPASNARSIWEAVSPARPAAPALQGVQDFDVAIIGGGFTGLSAALHLGQKGHAVCVLEGRTIGWGGSGRNNGQVIPVLSRSEPDEWEQLFGKTGERFSQLVRSSADFLFRLVKREQIECEAEQSGWFQPAHTPDHVRISELRCKAWEKRGANCSLLDSAETRRLLGSDQWYGGMLQPSGGHINPLMLARGLARACERAGVKIYENSIVRSVVREQGKWRVQACAGAVTARATVLATNAYSNELAGSLETRVARSVVPVTSWQMSTNPLCSDIRRQILPGRQAVSDTRNNLHFFRYDARNQLITGASLVVQVNTARRLVRRAGERLRRAFPQLGDISFNHIWSGYVGIMPDHLPHFHRLGPDYWAAIGYNGRGVALSVSAGKEIAKAVLGDGIKDLALPVSEPKPIPVHGLARRLAHTALIYYRWKDRQKTAI